MSKEIRDIRAALRRANSMGERCALATVVRAEGSSYRKVGARMLVTELGQIAAGCVSGGCLEADVVERAVDTITSGVPNTAKYDTRSDDSEIIFGWGTGCSGLIEVLIEPIDGRESLALPIVGDELRRDVALLTFYGSGLISPERVLIDDTGHVLDTDRTTPINDDITKLALETIRSERSRTISADGMDVCLEFIAPTRSLIIYGTGPDAASLADLARHVGWTITLADHRAIDTARFSEQDHIVTCRPETVADHIDIDHQTALVIMSHNYLVDRELLCSLAQTPLRYIGLLGSSRRATKLKADLDATEDEATVEALNHKLHAPVGLDIGASTPQMIALAIIAQIESVFSKRLATTTHV